MLMMVLYVMYVLTGRVEQLFRTHRSEPKSLGWGWGWREGEDMEEVEVVLFVISGRFVVVYSVLSMSRVWCIYVD